MRTAIGGRVVYADTGNPVRRAEVTLVSAATGERLGAAVTGVRGEFGFKDIPAGHYFLAAAAPSLVTPFAPSPPGGGADVLDIAGSFGYDVRFLPVGDEDTRVGAPTQMGVFTLA